MAATTQEKPKRSFEFRMSKKVAELTQVVHMLFTRNHEKEVEIDALKKAYEKEIELAIEDAKERIAKLQQAIEDQAKLNARVQKAETKKHEDEMRMRELDWQKKFTENDQLLQEERIENQNLRDLLINAQGDIQNLRQGASDELSSKSDEIRRREREMERLKTQLTATETELHKSQCEAQAVITELQRTNEKLEDQVDQLHNAMDHSNKTRNQLIARNKQLEQDMKALKREFNRKSAEMTNSQSRGIKNNMSADTNLELERLRREVQRYRLELSNRDSNFNRMFTEKQPVLLYNQRNNSSNQPPSNALYTSTNQPPSNALYTSYPQNTPANSNGLANTNTNFSRKNSLNNSFKERLSLRIGSGEKDKNVQGKGGLDRQMTFMERIPSHERLIPNGVGDDDNQRPQTHGNPFAHERFLNNAKDRLLQKQTMSLGDDPHQILPQRPSSNNQERVSSSSLPSICSTPEGRKTLVKPKPLPREMLYGK